MTILFFTASCGTTKFKDFIDEDSIVNLNGKIKSLTSLTIRNANADTLKTIIYYNEKNLPIKQIDIYKTGSVSCTYLYDNKYRLVEEKIDSPTLSDSKYEYDNKNNIINFKQFKGNKVFVEKKYTYDHRNNVTKEIYLSETSKDTAIFSYNYKHRKCTTKFSSSNNSSTLTYNKNGYIIHSEYLTKNNTSSTMTEYDKFGNITKRNGYSNGDLNYVSDYQHKYDNKANLIETTVFGNKKIIKKIIYIIDYK